MQRRICVFNKSLQKKYPFIRKQKNRSDSDVYCEICSSNFCIANSGLAHIRRHIITGKHQRALRESTNSQSHSDENESISSISTQKTRIQGTEHTKAISIVHNAVDFVLFQDATER